MGKIKNMSLKGAFMMYMLVFILLGLVVAVCLNAAFSNAEAERALSYVTDRYGDIEYWNARGIYTSEGIYYIFSDEDSNFIRICSIMAGLSLPLPFIGGIIMAGLLFYRNKLKEPIEMLINAAGKISKNDLDFHIYYPRRNEMGQLCASFELMRHSLEVSNRENWRAMEERRRINAAFSHDLRTPLTVLRGYVDMLGKYLPDGRVSKEKMIKVVQTMGEHIQRLENYVSGMSTLQKLEDISFEPQLIEGNKVEGELKASSEILCREKDLKLEYTERISRRMLRLDEKMVLQVLENLMANAVRYGKEKIKLTLYAEKVYFTMIVEDDGEGFSSKAIENATSPFYKEKENVYDAHFGLGLNICKVLCEKHGGFLEISNSEDGGGRVRADFRMDL